MNGYFDYKTDNQPDMVVSNDVIYALSPDFDDMISAIKKFRLEHPSPVVVVKSNQVVTGKIPPP
jgi:hypothetical protein